LGADVVIHSLTKYIGGHSDVTGGALILNCPKMYEELWFNMKCLGNVISPFSAYLCLRGSKTLEVRAVKAADNALIVAKHLEKHPKIEKVIHPGLKSHPHYAVAQKNKLSKEMNGGSGMMGIYVKGDLAMTNKFLSSLKLFVLAESLGGVECLIESPALMTHGSVPAEHRKMLGIDDNFCRVSIGIESVKDIIADIE
jgi:cystathionine gamma-lyase